LVLFGRAVVAGPTKVWAGGIEKIKMRVPGAMRAGRSVVLRWNREPQPQPTGSFGGSGHTTTVPDVESRVHQIRDGSRHVHELSMRSGGRNGMHARMPTWHCGQSRSWLPVTARRISRQALRLGNRAEHQVASSWRQSSS